MNNAINTNKEFESEEPSSDFLDQYNKEIDAADAAIDAGEYLTHEEVVQLFADRRMAKGI